MSVVLAGCPQPAPYIDGTNLRRFRECLHRDRHGCLCRVYAQAKQRCIDKGEDWR